MGRLHFTAAVAALGLVCAGAAAELITVEPERATELVENVDCGWYSADHSDTYEICRRRSGEHKPYRHSQVIYTRRVSNAWESAPGEYEGNAVKIVESWMKAKRRASFRVWAQKHSELPAWWRSKVKRLPPGNYHNGCDLRFWDETYVEHHKQLIEALGKKWNGSPYLAWVDVGAVGNSGGEWCIFKWEEYAKHGLTKDIYFELCKKMVDIYRKAFPDTQLIIAHDCMGTSGHKGELERFLKDRRVGIRNDGLGMGPDKLCWAKPHFLAFYETLPTMFENVVQWRDGDANTRTCLDAAVTAHPLYVRCGTNCMSSEHVEQNAPKILDEYGRKFGYHIRVKKAQYQSPSSGSLDITMLWTNEGTSPCYVDHGLELSLLTSSNRVALSEVVKPQPAVPKWMPGTDIPMRVRLKLPRSKAGKFAIAVRLVHPRKDWPWPVKLEMKKHTPEWRYIIGTVQLRGGGLVASRRRQGESPGGEDAPAPPPSDAAAEKEAGRIFQMARQADRMGQREVARRLYEQIVERFAKTEMAAKARKRLEKK